MKKLLLALLLIAPLACAYADNEDPCANGSCIASTSYVKGAVGTLQPKLSSSNVTSSGTGAVVTAVSANNGSVTVTRANVQIPSGGANATNYSSVWIQ